MLTYDELVRDQTGGGPAPITYDPIAPVRNVQPSGLQYSDLVQAQTAPFKTPILTVEQQQPSVAINLPTPNYNITNTNSNALTAGVSTANKTLQDYINERTLAPTKTETDLQKYLSDIASLTSNSKGKEQYQIEQENTFGVPQLKNQIGDLNSSILSGLAELNKMQTDFDAANLSLEQRPQQLGSVVGTAQQENQRTYSILRASKASEIGLLQARQQALGGQLDTAINLASKAVDLKYGIIEDELKVKQAQINAILPILDKEEKIKAQALTAFYNDEQSRLEEEKAKSKDNLGIALNLGINNTFIRKPTGEVFQTSTGQGFSSLEDFLAKTGMTLEQAYQKGMVSDVSAQTLADFEQVSQLKAKYWDAGLTGRETLEQASQIINNKSQIRAKELKGTGNTNTDNRDVTVADRNKYYLPITVNRGELSKVKTAIDSVIQQTGQVNDQNRYELWDAVAQAIKDAGLNPTDFDGVLWEAFHPQGLTGFRNMKSPSKTSSSSSSKKTLAEQIKEAFPEE